MNRVKVWVSTVVLGLLATTVYAGSTGLNSPIGYWKTIDDVTGRPKSIIRISKAENNVLTGKVIKIFPKEGKAEDKICAACEGHKHNQPIVGMVILSGLKLNKSQWSNGEILDPENGKTYSCSLRVAENGNKLNVHGYIGIPLLGRSQLWERVDLMSDK